MVSEPILVFYKSMSCTHCRKLTSIWEDVIKEVRKVYPHMRFTEVVARDNTGFIDENVVPKGVTAYNTWFPMLLLIPGGLWDSAMANLGPKNPVELKDGVQVINASRKDDGSLKYSYKYDIRQPAEIVRWIKDSYQVEDFKQVQNSNTPIMVPRKDPIAPIKPLLTTLPNPSNVQQKHVPAMEDSICSMRIISRPS